MRTSNQHGAGTDANVFMDLRGALGATGRVVLRNPRIVNPFERGQADDFEVKFNDLGALSEMVLGHDGTGTGASWHCEQVEVTDTRVGQVRAGGTWLAQ